MKNKLALLIAIILAVAAPARAEYELSCDYNTYLAEHNFLEIVSMSERETAGWAALLDNEGTLVHVENFALKPYARTDIDLHSIVGPQKYGSIIIYYAYKTTIAANGESYYMGEPGVRGAVSQYRDGHLSTTNPCVVTTIWNK